MCSGPKNKVIGQVARQIRIIGEAIEDEVVFLLAGLVVEAVEQAAIEERDTPGDVEPVGGLAEVGFVAPEVGDAVVLVVALAGLLLLTEGALVGRHVERAEEEVL